MCKYIVAINENTSSVVNMPPKWKRMKYTVHESHRACKNRQDLVKKVKCYLTRVYVDDRAKNNREYPWRRVASPSQSQNRWDTLTHRTTRTEESLIYATVKLKYLRFLLYLRLYRGDENQATGRVPIVRSIAFPAATNESEIQTERCSVCYFYVRVCVLYVFYVFSFSHRYMYLRRSIGLKIYTF